MRRVTLSISSLPSLMLASMTAAAGLPAHEAAGKVFDPQSFTLDNGLKVVVVTNRRVPAVAHMLWYRVGAADEERGLSGAAHLLEHMMFRGTEKVKAGEFSQRVTRSGGSDNAFTSYDYTAYFQIVSRDNLPMVMEMEADRMGNLLLDAEAVMVERDVVLEERRQRVDNDPASLLVEAARAALYANHPYGTPVIGWEHELRDLDEDSLRRFYQSRYTPPRAILVVSGDIDAAELRPLAEASYGILKAGGEKAAPLRRRPLEPVLRTENRVTLRDANVRQPALRRYFRIKSLRHAEDRPSHEACLALARLLGGGTTSFLYRRLVEDEGVASFAGASYDPHLLDYNTFSLYAYPAEGTSLAVLEERLDAAVAAFASRPPEESELARAQTAMLAEAVYARDSLIGPAYAFGLALTTGHTVEDVESYPRRIEALTVGDLEDAARYVLAHRASLTALLTTAAPAAAK